MRLRIKEFRSFVVSIEAASMHQSDFNFVKKRGWLNIIHIKSKKTFKYHRKKETKLDKNLQWIDTYEFWIETVKGKKELKANEAEVLSAFETWLKTVLKK